ncbi:hypothetical protein H5410_003713 [Solanum commersonii]|uniref:Uncharacterized protein n=1 Tax=Solanum commersonii TaxID=4109 RepID=A0A9J6B5X6_SOLCO|nr:hypothetical protein H5410_003713 [Solanum commersonii]
MPARAKEVPECWGREGVKLKNQILNVTPIKFVTDPLSKDDILCERILITGLSRWRLSSYSSAYQVSWAPSAVTPDRLLGKLRICFHKNSSLGLCQCEHDAWKNLQNGPWNSVMSPYEDRILDVKLVGGLSGSVTVTIEEDLQRWRLLFLAFGIMLLLVAPIVSSWVPFYYSSSMAIGVCLVIIVLLFQGMKLLPTGRKNIFYLTIYGSVLGAGSVLVHQFSMLINSIVSNFGLSEEFHNAVAVFILVGIILAGAGLGYWLVRKFVISDDGNVDVGVAQFVKWAIRIIGITFIFQSLVQPSSSTTPLAPHPSNPKVNPIPNMNCSNLFKPQTMKNAMQNRAIAILVMMLHGEPYIGWTKVEVERIDIIENLQHAVDKFSYGWLELEELRSTIPTQYRGFYQPNIEGWLLYKSNDGFSDGKGKKVGEYYSTFHKTPNRKRFSPKEWEDFTQESTKEAVAELASSPEFTDWIIKHADRIQLLQEESSDESVGSGSDPTDDNDAESCSGLGLFKWRHC